MSDERFGFSIADVKRTCGICKTVIAVGASLVWDESVTKNKMRCVNCADKEVKAGCGAWKQGKLPPELITPLPPAPMKQLGIGEEETPPAEAEGVDSTLPALQENNDTASDDNIADEPDFNSRCQKWFGATIGRGLDETFEQVGEDMTDIAAKIEKLSDRIGSSEAKLRNFEHRDKLQLSEDTCAEVEKRITAKWEDRFRASQQMTAKCLDEIFSMREENAKLQQEIAVLRDRLLMHEQVRDMRDESGPAISFAPDSADVPMELM
jgi:hypothetical protein